MKPKLLITGASGKIGAYFARCSADRYNLRLADRIPWDTDQHGPLPGEERVMDMQDLDACRQACAGIDTVIHLAADADPDADFLDSLLENNILATYNIFRAARDAGCQRMIYASSAHVVSAYPPDIQLHSDMAVRPRNLYGVTKCFGEALGAYFAYAEGLPTIVLRIGAYIFEDEFSEASAAEADAYLSPDDFNHLLVQCIETPDIEFTIAHAISDNRFKRLDLTETRAVLNYHPEVDVFKRFNLLP